MSPWLTTVLHISIAGCLVGILYINIKAKKWIRLCLSLIVLEIIVYFLNRKFGYPFLVESKGPVEETVAIVLSYLCMVLGMVAQYFYRQAESSGRGLKIEIAPFLMPIFASPIVFIPLLAIIQDTTMGGGAFAKAKIMLYLVAFQNGFFWKDIFDRQRMKTAVNPDVPSEEEAV